jgi:hypothetical protein
MGNAIPGLIELLMNGIVFIAELLSFPDGFMLSFEA